MPFGSAYTLPSNRFKSVFMQERKWVDQHSPWINVPHVIVTYTYNRSYIPICAAISVCRCLLHLFETIGQSFSLHYEHTFETRTKSITKAPWLYSWVTDCLQTGLCTRKGPRNQCIAGDLKPGLPQHFSAQRESHKPTNQLFLVGDLM